MTLSFVSDMSTSWHCQHLLYSGVLAFIFWSAHLKKKNLQFLKLFSPAHFQIVSTATIKLLHYFGFICALILGYTVQIFCTTNTNNEICSISCLLAQITVFSAEILSDGHNEPLSKNLRVK